MCIHRRLLLAALAAVALAGLLATTPSPAEPPKAEGKKVALLVGVNDYDNRNLENLKYAERDVTELADVLKNAGFTVRVLLGSKSGADKATRANVEAALDELLKGVGKKDTVLLAFSGHGAQLLVKEKNADGKEEEQEAPFFVPTDGVPTDASKLTSLNAIQRTLDERGGGANLMLVDACRNVVDPNKGARGGVDGSQALNLREGTAVFYSCSSRQKSRETDKAGGGHGVFFHFVLEGLRGAEGATNKGQVTWGRLVDYVNEQVKEKSPDWFPGLAKEEQQQPHAISNLTNEVVLVTAKTVPPPPPVVEMFHLDEDFSKVPANKVLPDGWTGDKDVIVMTDKPAGPRLEAGPGGQYKVQLAKQSIKGDFYLEWEYDIAGGGPNTHLQLRLDGAGGKKALVEIYGRPGGNADVLMLDKTKQGIGLDAGRCTVRLERKGEVYSLSVNGKDPVLKTQGKAVDFSSITFGMFEDQPFKDTTYRIFAVRGGPLAP